MAVERAVFVVVANACKAAQTMHDRASSVALCFVFLMRRHAHTICLRISMNEQRRRMQFARVDAVEHSDDRVHRRGDGDDDDNGSIRASLQAARRRPDLMRCPRLACAKCDGRARTQIDGPIFTRQLVAATRQSRLLIMV